MVLAWRSCYDLPRHCSGYCISKVMTVAMIHACFFPYPFSKLFLTFNSAYVGVVKYLCRGFMIKYLEVL